MQKEGGFEEGHVKGWVNSVPGWKFELVGVLINLSLYLKRNFVHTRPKRGNAPAVLVVLTVCPEVAPKFLDFTFSLAVSLGVVARGQAHSDS